jgi:Uma2 family endonuclease
MAANPLHRMTVEEFRALPEAVGEFTYELHHGELVVVTLPKLKHWSLQKHVSNLLEDQMLDRGEIGYEVAFRAFPEFDLRVADVA